MLDPAGHETVLYNSTGELNGGVPRAAVIRDEAGTLYGTAIAGGAGGLGVAYKLDPSGSETVLCSFTGKNGSTPESPLTRDSAGKLYGNTELSAGYAGVLYKIDAAGNETVLHRFQGAPDQGGEPMGPILAVGGALYGTTFQGGDGRGLVYKVGTAGNFHTIYALPNESDGVDPQAGVILDAAGNMYGTTEEGGTTGRGVVFKVDPQANETILYTFTGGSDGRSPYGGLTLDAAGNLYGTTRFGGAADSGVVFKLDTAGHETVLYSFTGGVYGANPYAGVILDADGNLYGTTLNGGAGHAGVVYKLDPSGNQIVLHTFGASGDGLWPWAPVVRDAAGNLYGTTHNGGSADLGTVYKLDAAGNETILHSFTNLADGQLPFAPVALDTAGNIYGASQNGAANASGVIFKLDPAGDFKALFTFDYTDGSNPNGVILDPAGNLFGSTAGGGAGEQGVVFKLDQAGHETVLYSFLSHTTGAFPSGLLARDAAGSLYGTTSEGGVNEGGGGFGYRGGILFKLKMD